MLLKTFTKFGKEENTRNSTQGKTGWLSLFCFIFETPTEKLNAVELKG